MYWCSDLNFDFVLPNLFFFRLLFLHFSRVLVTLLLSFLVQGPFPYNTLY